MAVTKANINDDVARIMARSSSNGAAVTEIVDYVWDLFITQAADAAPVASNETQANIDEASTAANLTPQE